MTKLTIGCAGWSYKDWIGPFYPKNLDPSKYLTFYSKFFNFVEINSTYYNLPSQEMVYNWNNKVPEDFRFSVKVWKEITHELNQDNLKFLIDQFFEQLKPLNEKISYYLLQFPPWFKYSEKHYDYLVNIINLLPENNNYVIEFRDNSWFGEVLHNNLPHIQNKIIGTSYLEGIQPFYKIPQKSYYIRLIGDRLLSSFNRVQRQQQNELDQLVKKIKQLSKDKDVKEIFIIVNNHYTGFAPETSNELKKKFGLPIHQFSKQKNLSEFL